MEKAVQTQKQLFKKVCKEYPRHKVIMSKDPKMVHATIGDDQNGQTLSFNVNGRRGKTSWALGTLNP